MKKRLTQAGLGLGLLGGIAVLALAGPMRGHPHLERARRSINQALSDCRAARADERHGEFGGHRDRAEELLNQAKEEIEKAAAYANSHR